MYFPWWGNTELTPEQIESLGWICIAFIGLSILIWLGDVVFGIIKTDEQRKIFNRTIGGTLLTAIVGFIGTTVLGDRDTIPPPFPNPSPSATASPANPSDQPEEGNSQGGTDGDQTNGTDITDSDEVGAQTLDTSDQDVEPVVNGLSANYPSWAESELPPRPFFDIPLGKNYPPCVADHRRDGLNGTIDAVQATSCYNQLQSYNEFTIVAHSNRRAEYIPALERRASMEPNFQRWQFLSAEFANFTAGEDAKKFERISAVFSCDEHMLNNLRQHALYRERAGCPKSLSGVRD